MSESWKITLFIAGGSPTALRARSNMEKIKSQLESGAVVDVEVSVLDVRDNPQLAVTHDILALPTLLRHLPEPSVRVIGDLSDTARVLEVLGG